MNHAGTSEGQYSSAAELAEQHAALVYMWVHRYRRRPSFAVLDFDDMVQEGCLGLMRAAELFDPDRGFAFSTYAGSWIRQKLLRMLDRHLRETSRFKAMETPEDCEREPLADSVTAAAEQNEDAALLMAALGTLTDKERDIVCSHYGIGKAQRRAAETAEIYGISRARVYEVKKQAMKKLRLALETTGAAV